MNVKDTLTTAVLRSDGGCSPNPGPMYGSYEFDIDGFTGRESRFKLGEGTNNVAEWQSLLRGLTAMEKAYALAGVNQKTVAITVKTDSMIVRNRLMGQNKVSRKQEWRDRSQVMHALACQCLEKLFRFGAYEVLWEGRATNVAVFGH